MTLVSRAIKPCLPVHHLPLSTLLVSRNQVDNPLESGSSAHGGGGGKEPKLGDDHEVGDQEWAMRVGSGILHLRATLPHIFESCPPHQLFPPTVYSNHITMGLPHPLPLKISGLPLYSFTFSLAKHGMQALHTDLDASLDKLTVLQPPSPTATSLAQQAIQSRRAGKSGMSRHKQVRVLMEVTGLARLNIQREPTSWRTSSLYTFSPLSGLISHHQVETIRPLPGESVGAWLHSKIWGWRAGQSEGLHGPVGGCGVGIVGQTRQRQQPSVVKIEIQDVPHPGVASSRNTDGGSHK